MQKMHNKPLSIKDKSIALVFDVPEKLPRSIHQPFPSDAEAEWETRETIDRIAAGWRSLGSSVIELPLDKFFLSRWGELHTSIDLVHSLVEGWGSVAREAWIPSLCELSGVPYIGSDPFAQCMAMRKSTFKTLCQQLGIPTPDFHLVLGENEIDELPDSFLNKPHFIKPDCEGSGMGIDAATSIGQSPESTRMLCRHLLAQFPDGILVEKLLPGQELTSAFIGGAPMQLLPIAQIEVADGVYGLANKSKEVMEEKVTFPNLPTDVANVINSAMLKLQRAVGLQDFVRIDWKLDEHGLPMLLEANPLAGLSYYYSVLPKMAAEAGLSYEDFLNTLATSALERSSHRKFWYGRARLNNSGAG
ncbi:hypothetical protein EBU99_10020 [bacterium]|nr:hypothetical protein [bacterium]